MAVTRSTNRVFLVSSVLLGVVAMVAAFVYLENSSGQEKGPKAIILVAKRDLRENTSIDPDKDLVELEIPARLIDLKARALSPDFKTSYKGQRVNRDVLAGTPVMIADLAASGTMELRGDRRAFSIPVKGVNAMSGLLVPGDYVKVLVTRPVVAPPRAITPSTQPVEPDVVEAPAPSRWETIIVSPMPFRVLAINQRMTRSRPQVTASDQYQSAGENTSSQTVTLDVTETEATLILAQTGGGQLPVTLLLCPPPTTLPSR